LGPRRSASGSNSAKSRICASLANIGELNCADHRPFSSAAALMAHARKACTGASEKLFANYFRFVEPSKARTRLKFMAFRDGWKFRASSRAGARRMYPLSSIQVTGRWNILRAILRTQRSSAREQKAMPLTHPNSVSCFRISSPFCLLNKFLSNLFPHSRHSRCLR